MTARATSAAPRKDQRTGTWSFVFDAGPGYDSDGRWRERRQVRRRGFATKKAAQQALDELRTDARNGELRTGADVTVEAWLTMWLETLPIRLKAGTVEFYRRTVRTHIAPRIGTMKLSQVDAEVLDRLYSDLSASGRHDGTGGLSAASVRHVHAVMSKALGDAVKTKRIRTNPARESSPPSIKATGRPAMSTWSAGQVAAFLSAERSGRYWSLWSFLFLTGCRRGEALGLWWEDVDLDAGQVSIRRSLVLVGGQPVEQESVKTSRSRRSIRLQPELVAALKAQRAQQAADRLLLGAGWPDSGLVFTLADGRAMHPKHVSRELERRLRRHGLPKIRLHDTRHTYATLALQAGVPITVVSARLGHESVAVTADIYSHVIPAVEAEHADAVAALITAAGESL